MEIVVILLIGGFVYFTPWLLAHSRKHPNTSAIAILNLLAGWTVIGWLVAIVWAATSSDKPSPATAPIGVSASDEIRKLAELREQGILTSEEFETKKRDILSRI